MDLTAGNLVLFGNWMTWAKPLWAVVAGAAAVLGLLLVASFLLRLLAPKMVAIARTTAKEAMSQPLFFVLLAIGIFALLIFPFVPYNTFGEDIKMLKAEGLILIKVLAIVLALWTASLSIAEEIEGRTALTVLSKPIGRRQLLIGKFLGILVPVILIFVVLGGLFLATVSFKVVYEARENSQSEPPSSVCLEEVIQITPGLGLAFLEAVVMTSIGVAISTRLPMLANLMICATIYVLGHLVPLLASSPGQNEIVKFVGQFFAAILPVLDHFSIETAISTGQAVPAIYLIWTTVYTLIYSAVALLVGLLMFEDRDLA
jgi:ABC-type transport system involved in multi-copper enzyme maturation permease subunit